MPEETKENSELLEDVFERIRCYEIDFDTNQPEIAPGYTFNQRETINRINLYYASKFETGNKDNQGVKFFFNISKPKVKNASKNIDFDTKDVMIKATNGGDRRKAWILRRDIHEWMRKRGLGKIINDSATKCARYGTVVAKKCGRGRIFDLIDLKNLKNDPTAETLRDSWKIFYHYYTPNELRRMSKYWDKVRIETAIKSFRENRKENYVDFSRKDVKQGDAQYIRVVEFYDNVPENWIKDDGKEDNYFPAQFIVVMPEAKSSKDSKDIKDKTGLILFKNQIKEDNVDENENNDLFRECHYDKEDGRWLGVGVMEDCFEPQMMKNENINQLMLAMKLANLILLATDDPKLGQNILQDVINGSILRLRGTLQRVDTSIRNMPANNSLSLEIKELSNQLSNSFEVTTGESMPSGTPLGLGQILQVEAMKYFNFVRQNFTMFWQEIFNDWIIPEAAKQLNKAHILEITNKEEMEWLFEEYKQHAIWEMIKKMLMSGKKPTRKDIDIASGLLQERFVSMEGLYLDIPDDFYKDILNDVECVIGNESFDKRERMVTLGNILQLLGANPALVNSPVFGQMLDISGLGEIDVKLKEEGIPQSLTMGQPKEAVAPQA